MEARLDYPSRTARVIIRMRPMEMSRAAMLAREAEIKVPELLRRLLDRAWRESALHQEGE